MGVASKIKTVVGTGAAYVVHCMGKDSSPAIIVSIIDSNRTKIQKFAFKHALDKSSPDAIQDNLMECLEYID